MDLAELIAPLPVERFLSEFWLRRPVHIRAQPDRSRPGIIGWDRLNTLLGQRAHWDADHLKLVMNSRSVPEEHYLDNVAGFGGVRQLANPAKVEAFLAMGASLVANEVQDAAPDIRALTDALGRRFGARAWGNLYASFRGVQAFASHCDTHEVFALHCAGEKRWRLYANPATSPIDTPAGDEAQAIIDAAKGPVILDVVLKPGDVLYIPRGWYHDAIASAEASLHLTIGVLPHTAQVLFGLLQGIAMQDPLFRDYLPDARADNGDALATHLMVLMQRLSTIAATRAFRDDVAVEQARAVDTASALSLPGRPELAFFARTDRTFTIDAGGDGRVLRSGTEAYPLGLLSEVAIYMLSRPAFSISELAARFGHQDRGGISALVAVAERMDLVRSYRPEL